MKYLIVDWRPIDGVPSMDVRLEEKDCSNVDDVSSTDLELIHSLTRTVFATLPAIEAFVRRHSAAIAALHDVLEYVELDDHDPAQSGGLS